MNQSDTCSSQVLQSNFGIQYCIKFRRVGILYHLNSVLCYLIILSSQDVLIQETKLILDKRLC